MNYTVGFTRSSTYTCLGDLQKDAISLCLIYCGWEHCEPSHRFGPNNRTSYVLHMVQKGKGILEINKKKYELGAGDAFLIPPYIEAWYEADKEEPWSYLWLGFTGIKAKEYITSAGFSLENSVRKITCLNKVRGYVDQILEAYQLTYSNELKRNGLLMMAFADLIEDYHENYAENLGKTHAYPGTIYVKHAIEYMTDHYKEKLKINDLADIIGVNRSYLTSSFKKNIGCSPQEFLMNLRIEKSKYLLKKTDMSINAVAEAVGYTDQLAFSKVFKQRCGVSPRTYKGGRDELVLKSKKEEYICPER